MDSDSTTYIDGQRVSVTLDGLPVSLSRVLGMMANGAADLVSIYGVSPGSVGFIWVADSRDPHGPGTAPITTPPNGVPTVTGEVTVGSGGHWEMSWSAGNALSGTARQTKLTKDQEKTKKAQTNGRELARLAIQDSRCASLFKLTGNANDKPSEDKDTPLEFLDWALANATVSTDTVSSIGRWGEATGHQSKYKVGEDILDATVFNASAQNGTKLSAAYGFIKIDNGSQSNGLRKSTDVASTILHEVGHLMNLLYGGGESHGDSGTPNSSIINDANDDKNETLHGQNKEIMKDCEKAIKEIAKKHGL
jgi:hypothetical protein